LQGVQGSFQRRTNFIGKGRGGRESVPSKDVRCLGGDFLHHLSAHVSRKKMGGEGEQKGRGERGRRRGGKPGSRCAAWYRGHLEREGKRGKGKTLVKGHTGHLLQTCLLRKEGEKKGAYGPHHDVLVLRFLTAREEKGKRKRERGNPSQEEAFAYGDRPLPGRERESVFLFDYAACGRGKKKKKKKKRGTGGRIEVMTFDP